MAHARTHAHTHARAHSHSQPQPDTQYPAAALVWLSARWLTARRHHLRGFQPECGLQPDLVFKEEAAARPGPGRRHWVVPCSCLCVAFSQVASSQTAPARWLSARVRLPARRHQLGGFQPKCGLQPGRNSCQYAQASSRLGNCAVLPCVVLCCALVCFLAELN